MVWDSELERLRALTCVKWTWFDDDVLPAWVADMDFAPAPVIVDAVRAMLDRGDLGYNFSAARRIPEVFVERQEQRYGWRPDVDSVRLFCDVMQAVETTLWLHTSPGDGVVLFTPVYPPFYRAIEGCGCKLVDVPLDPLGWRLDPQRLAEAIATDTRVILLCNPHNPTGRVFTREELEVVAQVAEKHDLLVISDEIWSDLVYPGAEHLPFASLSAGAAERAVTVTAASKAFSIAGLRCALAHLGHSPTAEKIAELPGHLLGGPGSLGAEATLAAWTLGDEWLAATLEQLRSNRDRVAERLAAELPEVGFTVPQATYLAWLDFSAYGVSEVPADWLLERGRVALWKGVDFGSQGCGNARLNFATYPELLDQILDRLVLALEDRDA